MTIEQIIIYVIGYFVTLILLFKFKKQLGIDSYNEPKTYVNYDDWSSNAQAYVSWSIGWPLVWVVFTIAMICKGLMLIAKAIEKITS
jgi:hypothetical protein